MVRGERTIGSRLLWEWGRALVAALVLWFLLRAMVIQAFRIPSSSMESALMTGDFLFVNKAVFGSEIPFVGMRLPAFRTPRRGDLVVFDSPEVPGLHVVKRVVGVPGDTLSMAANRLYLNRELLEEPYVVRSSRDADREAPALMAMQRGQRQDHSRAATPTLRDWGPVIVPADSVFVLGDNRDNSYDSRYWGFLGRHRIVGQPLFIYYSYDGASGSFLPPVSAIRWDRIFSVPQ